MKKKLTHDYSYDILGVILITVGILLLFSLLFSNSIGILGNLIKKLLLFLIGIGSYIFPFLIIFIGLCYIIRNKKIMFSIKFYGILIFIIDTILLIQLFNIRSYKDIGIYQAICRIYESTSIWHGGILSLFIDMPLYKFLGFTGCCIVFASVYIISFIMIFQHSIHDWLMQFKVTKPKANINEKPLINNQNDFIKNLNNKIKIIDFMKSTDKPEIKEDTTMNNEEISDQVKKEIEEKHSSSPNFKYEFPSADLLNINKLSKLNKDDKVELINDANKLEETLNSFGVEAKVIQVTKGPSVTRFELQPNSGVKVSKIVNLADDIALSLASSGVRIEAPIPGKSAVGIEVPNKHLTPVLLREVIESPEFKNSKKNLAFCLGKDISGNCVVSDLTKMPHLLIAGATGSGKSVCINALIISLIYKYSPEDVKLLLIDPKVVELNIYNGIPHLLIPVVTDPKKAAGALNWAVNEMIRRYKLFADNNVRNIEGYNELKNKGKIDEKLPLVVIIIDELADLMMACANDVENYIGRLTQMARAAGMHLVIATQRPSVDIITGVIKSNIPSRISFAVSSQIDSRTILDMAGAEKLLGKGDMLFYPLGENKPLRIQGAFISEQEVEKVVDFIKKQQGSAEYKEEIIDEINSNSAPKNNDSDKDELLEEAKQIVIDIGQASTSLLQRRLRIGYNRAARIIDELEDEGIISARDGSKPRQVLVDKNNYNNM